jgi:hypothetical protein
MSQEKKFIKTADKETSDKLIAAGFQLISNESGVYTFLNQVSNFNFENVDIKKMVYTNTLSF